MNDYIQNVARFEKIFDCTIKIETQERYYVYNEITTILITSKKLFNMKFLPKEFHAIFMSSLIWYNIIDGNKNIVIDFIENDKILIFMQKTLDN